MVVNLRPFDLDEEGQSILEFLLTLPLLVGLTVILIKVNTAIQMSIVNQQYSRAQALFLAFNSPVYPILRLQQRDMVEKGYNQIVLGVSDNAPGDEINGGGEFVPKASVQNIALKPGQGSDEPHTEPQQRAKIRIRNTITLCTQPVVIDVGGRFSSILPLQSRGAGGFEAAGVSRLSENTSFQFCRSPRS